MSEPGQKPQSGSDSMLENPFTGQRVTQIVADYSGNVCGKNCEQCEKGDDE
jgi:hypothetical protein